MTEKKFRTISDVMNQPADDTLAVIATIAPAIERVATKSGLLHLILEKQGTAVDEAEAIEIVESVVSALMRYALGECMDDMKEIIAAVNGMTVEELGAQYTGWDVFNAAKVIISDKDFFSLLQSLIS